MMMFLYGMVNLESDELPAQARLAADSEPEALRILKKSFGDMLMTEDGEETILFKLLDVQEVTDPELEIPTIFIQLPNKQIWTTDRPAD
jgi:hypothetical protein